jgi:hypothetical protein
MALWLKPGERDRVSGSQAAPNRLWLGPVRLIYSRRLPISAIYIPIIATHDFGNPMHLRSRHGLDGRGFDRVFRSAISPVPPLLFGLRRSAQGNFRPCSASRRFQGQPTDNACVFGKPAGRFRTENENLPCYPTKTGVCPLSRLRRRARDDAPSGAPGCWLARRVRRCKQGNRASRVRSAEAPS